MAEEIAYGQGIAAVVEPNMPMIDAIVEDDQIQGPASGQRDQAEFRRSGYSIHRICHWFCACHFDDAGAFRFHGGAVNYGRRH